MNMRLRKNTLLKAVAFLLAVVCFTAAVLMSIYQGCNAEVIWGGSDVGEGYTARTLRWQDLNEIRAYLDLLGEEAMNKSLGSYSQQYKEELEERFAPENTNLRWYAVNGDGSCRWGNTGEQVPEKAMGYFQTSYSWVGSDYSASEETEGSWFQSVSGAVNLDENYTMVAADDWREQLFAAVDAWVSVAEPEDATGAAAEDRTNAVYREETVVDDEDSALPDTVYMSADYLTDVLVIVYNGEKYVYGPTVRAFFTPNEFGYIWDGGWNWTGSGVDLGQEELSMYLWLEEGLPVADEYARAAAELREWTENRDAALAATVLLFCAGIAMTVFLCMGTGHRRGYDGVWLNWFHRIPGDLMLAGAGGSALLLAVLACECVAGSSFSSYAYFPVPLQNVLLAALVAGTVAVILGYLVTFVARCKGHTLLRNTVVWRLCAWVAGGCCAVLKAIPLIWQVLAVMGMYGCLLLLGHRSGAVVFLLWGAALVFVGLWALQWQCVRAGTKKMLGGETDEKIDTRWMLPDLRDHAETLNNLGGAISNAVDERMRSERFKAELITNVSHDLKTPLTSIINYVDLLKKEPIEDPTVQEYIAVLDRKSQRLKKLTEDLVEASKASTGSLNVVRERIGLVQLADQALAEYEERLAGKQLSTVRVFPEDEVWVEADGRHLWRVLDNLLSNCAKYALEGTRVYVEVQRFGDGAVLSVKNISREALNIPPELLVERFVRGDESRATEGSGLGLSIAQSLTELQNGQFTVSIDGDLFKAGVTLPLADRG